MRDERSGTSPDAGGESLRQKLHGTFPEPSQKLSQSLRKAFLDGFIWLLSAIEQPAAWRPCPFCLGTVTLRDVSPPHVLPVRHVVACASCQLVTATDGDALHHHSFIVRNMIDSRARVTLDVTCAVAAPRHDHAPEHQ